MATKPIAAKSPKAAARIAAKPARKSPMPKKTNETADGTAKAAKTALSLRLKGLLDGVSETSGAKKKDVKTIVEAALVQIGAALARGESVNLPGLGHLRVARKGTAESPSMTLKLRQGDGSKGKGKSAAADDKESLAEDSDQG